MILKNIFVGNLAFTTSEDQLRNIFEQFGAVERVAILSDRDTGKSRGFGFVEMPNGDEANRAIEGLNGSDFMGRALNVNEARPKPPKDRY